MPAPDAVFIGGSGGMLPGILAAVWVLLGGFAVWNLLKKKRTGNR